MISDEMSESVNSRAQSQDARVEATGGRPTAWFTITATTACVANFLLLRAADDIDSWDTMRRHGSVPASDIWTGSVWALVTSPFVHVELWHLIFNVYWLWKLGSCFERQFGCVRSAIFFAVAAFVSSTSQLAFSDTTGIGMSGVVYAYFGFMWRSLPVVTEFRRELSPQTVQLMLVWLFVCVFLTYSGALPVGNAAHFAGLFFGALTAYATVLPERRGSSRFALAMLLLLAILPLMWCPWSPTWLGSQALEAHSNQDFPLALRRYSQLLNRDPNNAWALFNRGTVHLALNQAADAERDFARAKQIDPTLGGD